MRRAAQGAPGGRNAEDHLRPLQIRDGADRDHRTRDHSPAQGEVNGTARFMMTARKTNPTARPSAGVKLCNLPRNVRQFRLARSFAPHVIIPTREPLTPRGRTRAERLNTPRLRCAAYSPNRSGSDETG